MATFFTADTHFGHTAIIEFCGRPFSTVHEMDEVLVDNWNSVVAPGDTVYHLGDFCWKSSDPIKLLARLNGQKHLIVGNHDGNKARKCRGWSAVYEHPLTLKILPFRVKWVLFHYPMVDWDSAFHGAAHLHGHTHGIKLPPPLCERGKRLDVGVDVCDYRPISLEDVRERLDGS